MRRTADGGPVAATINLSPWLFLHFTPSVPWPSTTVPLQVLACEIADTRGLDVDQPRNLAKSVTVE